MGHHHVHHSDSSKNIATAFFLNLAFTLIEFIGGFYTNSLAIMSDALHDLGDSLSLGLAWYFQKLSSKKATKTYSYGYKRFSLLGAIINSIILIVGSIFIITEAIPRIINPENPNAKGMMWLAILGIFVNGAAVLKLKKGKTLNERVVSLHLLEDVLGWIAVLVASIIMQFWEIPILDPILSLAIALYVLFNVFKNIKESVRIILQGSPQNISVDDIRMAILDLDEVTAIHDCHIWTMDGEYNIFTAHLVVKNKFVYLEEIKPIKIKVKHILKEQFSLEHITLEIETEKKDCSFKN